MNGALLGLFLYRRKDQAARGLAENPQEKPKLVIQHVVFLPRRNTNEKPSRMNFEDGLSTCPGTKSLRQCSPSRACRQIKLMKNIVPHCCSFYGGLQDSFHSKIGVDYSEKVHARKEKTQDFMPKRLVPVRKSRFLLTRQSGCNLHRGRGSEHHAPLRTTPSRDAKTNGGRRIAF